MAREGKVHARLCTREIYLTQILHEERKLLSVHLAVTGGVVRLPNLEQLGIAELLPRKLH